METETAPVTAAQALDEFLDAIALKGATQPSADRPIHSTPNPYPGLRYFTADISEVFVGRDEQIDQVLERLGKSQTVLILGGSGCGKSSLIRGGVLSRLSSTTPVPGRRGAWYSVAWRPERRPCGQLKEAFCRDIVVPALTRLQARWISLEDRIAQAQSGDSTQASNSTRGIEPDRASDLLAAQSQLRELLPEQFRAVLDRAVSAEAIDNLAETVLNGILVGRREPSHPGLSELRLLVESFDRLLANDPCAPGANVLFVIDQFEEVFRREVDPGERRTLMALIRYAYELKPRGVFLALVMRSEDLHRCAEEPHLPEIVNSSSMFVDWLDRPQLRRVIVEPARRVVRSWLAVPDVPNDPTMPYDTDVVDELLDEAEILKETLEHKGDHLPILQHGLRALWRHAAQEWREAAELARKSGSPLTPDRLRIRRSALDQLAMTAEEFVRERNPSDTDKRTKLQWLLAYSAEGALESATNRYAANVVAAIQVPAQIAIKAAFCEMATLDENRRYFRKFRTADEIVASRFPATHARTLAEPISAALEEFRSPGLLTRTGSGAWDVTHEALIRNWDRLVKWVAQDVTLQRALRDALQRRKIGNWDQARILRPLFGLRKSQEYSRAWARSMALSPGDRGEPPIPEAEIPGRLAQLNRSYRWIRWRTPLFGLTGAAVILFAVVTLTVYQKNNRLELQTDLMRAYAVAANVLKGDVGLQNHSDRALELLKAAEIWKSVRREMVEDNAPPDDPLQKELSLTESTIDDAARNLLGKSFWVQTASGDLDPRDRPVCGGGHVEATPGTPDDDIATWIPPLDANPQRAVKLQGRRQVLKLYAKMRGSAELQQVNIVPGLLPGDVQDSHVCVSGDGSVLTVSGALSPLPQIFHLLWYPFDKDFLDGAVAPLQIVNHYHIQEISVLDGATYHGPSPQVIAISGPDAVSGKRQVRFTVQLPNQRTADLTATYYEGYAAPQKIADVHSERRECEKYPDDAAVHAHAAAPSCAFTFDDFTLTSLETPTPFDARLISNSISLHAHHASQSKISASDDDVRETLIFYGPPARTAAVAQQGHLSELYLGDDYGEVWRIILPADMAEISSGTISKLAAKSTGERPSSLCRMLDCLAANEGGVRHGLWATWLAQWRH